jgi:hypothetical protein
MQTQDKMSVQTLYKSWMVWTVIMLVIDPSSPPAEAQGSRKFQKAQSFHKAQSLSTMQTLCAICGRGLLSDTGLRPPLAVCQKKGAGPAAESAVPLKGSIPCSHHV